MTPYEYRIHITLPGETEYHLCTVYSAEAVAAVMAALCGAARPNYHRVSVMIAPLTPV